MPIVVNLDVMLARRKMRLNELAERVDITPQNLSVLKTGRARAIRFSTLEKLCEVLECQPGDLFAFEPDAAAADHNSAAEPGRPRGLAVAGRSGGARARRHRACRRRGPLLPKTLLGLACARRCRALDRPVAAHLLGQPRKLDGAARIANRRARPRCDRAPLRNARAARARDGGRRSCRTDRASCRAASLSFASTRRIGSTHGPSSYFFGRPVARSCRANSGGEK